MTQNQWAGILKPIREEAIKWFKDDGAMGEKDYDEHNGVYQWIRHFFNITEEELQ